MRITAQGPRLRNDLYCVELDVKLYYTIPCAQLLGPVHTARLGRVFFCVLCLCFVCSFVLFDLFVCLFFRIALGS